MEVVQLLGMALVYCPCFTCVEQRGESAEGRAGPCNSDAYLVINGDILRQRAAKIGEPVHCTESLTVDCNVGLNKGFPWGRLVQYFSLLYADGETEVCACYGKFVYAALHISF